MASRSRPGKSAVGRIALGQDQQILFLLRQQIVVGAEKTANVRHAIFLGGHGAAIAMREHFLSNLLGRFRFVSLFSKLNEVGVFGETASVEVKRNFVLPA